MSSANEHLPPPPKPRMSPLDFRNTDLVSRLLAATPPYLYNMSLLPNTYFFSEMLRSFVQAKTDQNNRANATTTQIPHTRRSRKRTWSSNRTECFQKQQQFLTAKSPEKPMELPTDWMLKSNSKVEEPNNPLELTISKTENSNEENVFQPQTTEQVFHHPGIPNSSESNLVLPPPPPIWYPPLYPAPPYGIDPLHFFIDLRVSGHIYDRKNQTQSNKPLEEKNEEQNQLKDIFKHPRHSSAFSVPIPASKAVNLSSPTESTSGNRSSTKFDVKSMGFDKSGNKTSTNYIMGNIKSIYQGINEHKEGQETEEEREKRVKDLRALIGLELVVDYMNHAKPGQPATSSQSVESVSSSNDLESIGSPTLEVVDIHDET